MIKLNNYTLFVGDTETWVENCTEDYLIEEYPKTQIINNGIILPLMRNFSERLAGWGGVCDEAGNFVTGHDNSVLNKNEDEWFNVYDAYPIPGEMNIVKETVVYGGMIADHFGHFIVESLSRLWWLLDNISCEYKFIFITEECTPDEIAYFDYLIMLGLKKENIVILREPTRFDAIIVPEQSTYLDSGYRLNAMSIYNAIRDSVTPASYEKVYFTRTKLADSYIVNEEYFEDYFRLRGYEIIAPERLSLKEQVSIMAGVKEFACTNGSLHHHILFANNEVNVTLINRYRIPDIAQFMPYYYEYRILRPMYWINQARDANCICIDASVNFLPHHGFQSLYFIAPNQYWKSYVAYINNLENVEYNRYLQDDDTSHKYKAVEYIEKWCKKLLSQNTYFLQDVNRIVFTFADFAITFHELFVNELDDTAKGRLKSVFERDGRLKILYGAGNYGKQAWNCYGNEQVYAFADINKYGTKYLGKPVIHPSALSVLSDEYEIVICAEKSEGMIEYLKNIGVEDFLLFL